MFFLVEIMRVEVAKPASAWDGECHCITKDVCNDRQEDERHKNGLWFEVEDLLKNRSKNGKTDA